MILDVLIVTLVLINTLGMLYWRRQYATLKDIALALADENENLRLERIGSVMRHTYPYNK